MDRTQAHHGFVVLSDQAKIVLDHRMSAIDISVTLLHDSEINDLASSWGGSTQLWAHVGNIEIWEKFLRCGADNRALDGYRDFALSSFWTTRDPGERCRKLISKLRAVGTELDPTKPAHAALFGDATCLLLLTLSELANKLMLLLLRPKDREEFSSAMLALLYGGHENLQTVIKLRQLATKVGDDDSATVFPELNRFEQLVREVVQAPLQALPAAILSRELAFDMIANNLTSSGFQSQIVASNPYAPKFVLIAAEFLRRAARLPSDFSQALGERALELLSSTSPPELEAVSRR